jgi:hypothetical protein
MYFEKMGFVTLSEEVPGESAYSVQFESTNGIMFRSGTQYTTLIAHVFYGGVEVTNELSSGAFIWTRSSESPVGDEAWNMAHSTGYKELELTPSDFYGNTSFKCNIREV